MNPHKDCAGFLPSNPHGCRHSAKGKKMPLMLGHLGCCMCVRVHLARTRPSAMPHISHSVKTQISVSHLADVMWRDQGLVHLRGHCSPSCCHCVQVAKKARDLQQYLSSLPREQCFYAMIQLMRRFTSQCEVQAGSGSAPVASHNHAACSCCGFNSYCCLKQLQHCVKQSMIVANSTNITTLLKRSRLIELV